MSHNEQAGRPAWQIELASVLTDIENEDKNNPVSQNIKLIMVPKQRDSGDRRQ